MDENFVHKASLEYEAMRIMAAAPVVWTGDLTDDCSAHWAGFLLRAEWMQGEGEDSIWWWAVTRWSDKLEIASSLGRGVFRDGEEAKRAAENEVRDFLGLF